MSLDFLILACLVCVFAGFALGVWHSRQMVEAALKRPVEVTVTPELQVIPEPKTSLTQTAQMMTVPVRAYDLATEHYFLGQGWAWDDTRIVTNAHVVDGVAVAEHVEVFVNGAWIAAKSVVWSDKADVALIRLPQDHNVPSPSFVGLPSLGQKVCLYQWAENRLSSGKVTSAEEETHKGHKGQYLTVSIPARVGDSGSPVLTQQGELAGMLSIVNLTEEGSDSYSYMVSAMCIRQTVNTLLSDDDGSIKKPSG